MNIEIVKAEDIDESYLKENDSLPFNHNKSRIVVVNNMPIGFYTTYNILGKLTLEYNLFKNNRNKNIGMAFVNIVTELAGRENEDYSTINLLIKYNNDKSIKVAEQNGYHLSSDMEFSETINEEMSGYVVLEKTNEFYKESAKEKNH